LLGEEEEVDVVEVVEDVFLEGELETPTSVEAQEPIPLLFFCVSREEPSRRL